MATHVLKTWPGPFEAVRSRRKTYEIRTDDRNFQVGDTLILRSYDPETESYNGLFAEVLVTYKTSGGDWGLPAGLCVLAIQYVMWGFWLEKGEADFPEVTPLPDDAVFPKEVKP